MNQETISLHLKGIFMFLKPV